MTNKQLLQLLDDKDACGEARDWVNGQSAEMAWRTCERPDWLFWICGELGMERKKIVLAACACARLALKFVKEGEYRPRVCIETAERWTRSEATIEEVRKARAAAYAADAAATDAAAYAAAYAAADAAYAAKKQMCKNCCNAIRKVVAFEDVLKLANHL